MEENTEQDTVTDDQEVAVKGGPTPAYCLFCVAMIVGTLLFGYGANYFVTQVLPKF